MQRKITCMHEDIEGFLGFRVSPKQASVVKIGSRNSIIKLIIKIIAYIFHFTTLTKLFPINI